MSSQYLDVLTVDATETLVIEADSVHVLKIGIAGPQGPMGLPGGVNDGEVTVLPSENRTIELTNNVLSNSWFLTFYDIINNLIKTCTVRASISGSFTVYGLEGSIMPVKVTVLNGLELKVKNNSASSILVKFQRISIEA